MFDTAKDIADARGMDMVQCMSNPKLARIKCRKCSWPYTPDGIYDVLIERYLAVPHGCFPCVWQDTHGWRPKMLCNGKRMEG